MFCVFRRLSVSSLTLAGLAYGAASLLGCSGSEATAIQHDAGPEEMPPPADAVGCDAWRRASCAYFERCNMRDPGCVTQLRAVQCSSEAQADQCAHTLDAARCGDSIADCDTAAIADIPRAIEGCHAYLDQVCTSATACALESSLDGCKTDAPLDCSLAVGVGSALPTCIDELKSLDCKRWTPPASCGGVVVLR